MCETVAECPGGISACENGQCCVAGFEAPAFCRVFGQVELPCCGAAVCGPGAVASCCLPGGEACTTDATCCSGSCVDGICQASALAPVVPLASGVRGSGEIALSADRSGFLAAYVEAEEPDATRVLGRWLAADGQPSVAQPVVIASRADLETPEAPGAPRFHTLGAAFAGGLHQLSWRSYRALGGVLDEVLVLARGIAPGATAPLPFSTLFSEVAFSMCPSNATGPLALAGRGDEVLMLWAKLRGCLTSVPIFVGEVTMHLGRVVGGGVVDLPIDPPFVFPSWLEAAESLTSASASLASRDGDALGVFVPKRVGPFGGQLVGVWAVGDQATRQTFSENAGHPAVASDGSGYLVAWQSPGSGPGGADELRAARFVTGEVRLEPTDGVVLGSASGIRHVRAVGVAPDRYLLVHEEVTAGGVSRLAVSRIATDGGIRVLSRQESAIPGDGEVLGVQLAANGLSVLALVARRDGAETYALTVAPL